MRDSAPNRPTLDVVNAVGSSVSLRLVADATFAPLARKFDVDLIATPSIGEHERLFFRAQRAAGKPPRQSLTFHLAHELAYAAYACPGLLKDQLRVLYTGWELEQLTDELVLELAGADVLLTFSEFTARTFRRYFPSTPVITVPVCPPLYFEARDDRRRFSLPPDAVIFLCVFDPISGMDRKNPLDVLDAFQQAFPDRDDVLLVFKVRNLDAVVPQGDSAGDEARRICEFRTRTSADPRVHVIDEHLNYNDILCLMASCDVFITLARAEGLGLPALEAMALGLPTICTNYSGFLDFATPESACLVPAPLVDIPTTASHYYRPDAYSESPRWSQPDVSAAADCMRRLADDPGLRTALGERAQARARQYRARAARASWVDDLAEALASPDLHLRHDEVHKHFVTYVSPRAAAWASHFGRLHRARFALRMRTRLGRAKRFFSPDH